MARACAGAGDRPLDVLANQLEPARTVVYRTAGDRSLRLHVFLPGEDGRQECRPAYLAFHGGGWTARTPRYFYPFAQYFAAVGMVGISVEYRLTGRDATVFDSVQDARSAVRYVRAHAAELGIDPRRVVVSGGSAGAHLAAGTALFDGVDAPDDDLELSCRPDLLVLHYPVIDTSAEGYGQSKIGPRWRELSPVDHVRPDLPPTLLLHGTGDTVTPFAGSARFHRRMLEAGNKCELIAFDGGRHGYFIFDMEQFVQAMAQTEDFIRRHGMLGV